MNKDYIPRHDDLPGMLDHLQEECAELILAVSKVKRFGLNNRFPIDGNETNFERMRDEMDDVEMCYRRIMNHLHINRMI